MLGLDRPGRLGLAVVIAAAWVVIPGDVAAGDEALVERGRQIYMEGVGASEITAVIAGDVEIPGSVLTCGSCHGPRGEGRPEGGVSPTDLRPSMLRRPYDVTTPSGRLHGPYDRRALVKAISMGLDPAGNVLQPAMPRYRMSRADMDALIAYLERLEDVTEAGVEEAALRIGVPIPAGRSGPDGEHAASAVVGAVLGDLSELGGIFGRRARMIEVEIDPRASEDTIRRQLVAADVFALVGGRIGPEAGSWLDVAAALGVPWVGPRSLAPRATIGRPSLFYLEPGLNEASHALADYTAERWPGQRVQVIRRSGADPQLDPIEMAFVERLAVRGEPAAERLVADPASPPRREPGRPVLLLVAGAEGRRILDSLADRPVLAVASLAADWLRAGEAPEAELHVAMPSASLTRRDREQATRLWAALAERHGLDAEPTAAAWHSLAAVRVLTEGLRRVGGDPRRDRFIAALETLREFETGVSPPVTFGPNRRTGFEPPPVLQIASAP